MSLGRNLFITFLNLLALAFIVCGGYLLLSGDQITGFGFIVIGVLIEALSLEPEKPTGPKTKALKKISTVEVVGAFVAVVVLAYMLFGR